MDVHINHREKLITSLSACFFLMVALLGTNSPAQTPLPQTSNSTGNQSSSIGSFRIILPKISPSPVEGPYDYSYQISVPRSVLGNAAASTNLRSGFPATPESKRELAHNLMREAELLKSKGTAQALLDAAQKYIESLESWEKAGNFADPAEMATAFNQLAFIADSLGDRQQAINYYHQSLPLWRAAGNRTNEAAALTQLGRIYNSIGDNVQAQNCFNQARLIVQTASLTRLINEAGNKGEREASTLYNLAKLYEEQGQAQKAFEHYQRSLPYWRQAQDKTGEASTLNSLGSLAARAGQLPIAAQLFQQALPLWREVGDKRGEAVSLSNLGYVADAIGDKPNAVEFYLKALPLWRSLNDKRSEAATLNDLGSLNLALGQREQALKLYLEALPIRRASGDKRGEATTLSNLGGLHVSSNDLKQALECFTQSLELRKAIGDKRGEMLTLGNLGLTFISLREPAKAQQAYDQGLSLAVSMNDNLRQAIYLTGLGEAEFLLNEKTAARNHLELALTLWRELKDNERETATQLMLAGIYSSLGDTEKAKQIYQQTLSRWPLTLPMK